MRRYHGNTARALLLWWLAVWPAVARAKVVESPYRDLQMWGAGVELHGKPRGDELRLTNRWTRLVFRKDSDRVAFNDVEFRLSDRIAARGGRFRVSQRDIDTLLTPLLSPPRRAGPPVRAVVVNAGHGGKDPGNLEGPRREKVFALALAKDVAAGLRAAGFTVVMTRTDDAFVGLPERTAIANRSGADLYLSLHFNSYAGAGAAGVRGLETYCLTPAGAASSNDAGRHGGGPLPGNAHDRHNLTLAHQVHRAILDGTELGDRGVRRARFKELTSLRMPGILVEGGYMSHPSDARTIYGSGARARLAAAIVQGVVRYKRLVERGLPE